jgi:heat shock protein HtpX
MTLIVFGHTAGGRQGLLFALIVVLGINCFIYFYEDQRILNYFEGKIVEGQDPYGIQEIVKRLSIQARIPIPKIVMIENNCPQSLAVGRGLSHGTLLLTSGVFDKLSRSEIETLIAYQLATLRSLNTLAFTVGSFLVSSCLLVTEILDQVVRTLLVEKKKENSILTQFFTRLLSPLVGCVLRLSVLKSFYYSADELTVQITGEPEKLAHVLWKLHFFSKTIPLNAPVHSAHMFIVNPLTDTPWNRYFHAQPDTAKRIERLVGYYPI